MNRLILSFIVFLTAIILDSCNEPEDAYQVRINIENLSDCYIDSLLIFSWSADPNGYRLSHDPFPFYALTIDQMGELQTCQEAVGQVLYFNAYINGDSLRGNWIYPHHRRDPAHLVTLPSDDYLFGIIEADTVNDRLLIGLLTTPYSW